MNFMMISKYETKLMASNTSEVTCIQKGYYVTCELSESLSIVEPAELIKGNPLKTPLLF